MIGAVGSVYALVRTGTAEEFKQAFDPETDSADELLFRALAHRTPEDRVAMAAFLLDEGADASLLQPPNSVLNVLFGQAAHDFELEAPLVLRMLEAGADINHRTRRGETPLTQLQNLEGVRDESMVPVYDVLLAWPELDLSLPLSPKRPEGPTVRESIFAPGGYLRRRLRTMIEERDL